MNSSTSSISVNMIPWLHFGTTDYLIFEAWRPSSHGAIAGACIGLFLFCVLERCLSACRRAQELRWRARITLMSSRLRSSSSKEGSVGATGESIDPTRRRLAPPFTPSHDIPRGIMQAIQSTFSYALMLAVMTFNGAYIVTIILGLGFGEVFFGRFGRKQEV